LQAPLRSAQSESAALAAAVSSQDDRPGTAGCVHYGCSHCGLPKPLKLLRLCSACNQAMYARSNGDRARLMNLAPQHVLACAAQPRRLPQYGPTAPAHSGPLAGIARSNANACTGSMATTPASAATKPLLRRPAPTRNVITTLQQQLSSYEYRQQHRQKWPPPLLQCRLIRPGMGMTSRCRCRTCSKCTWSGQ
jgi:hypothetical protein